MSSSAPTTWGRCRACSSARATTARPSSRSSSRSRSSRRRFRPSATRVYSGWVSISVGCNNTCTFCIVPSLRGKEKDRRPGDILNEIRLLVDDGAIEVTLLGQNVNSYGVEFGDRQAFGKLLRAAGEIEGLERIRFTSPHPAAFTDDVIDAMAETPAVMPQLHMPLQSGQRPHPQGDAPLVPQREVPRHPRPRARRASRTRRSRPTSSSGFPGETEEDFEETMRVVEQARFASAFTFQYSIREGTPAATMADQVPKAVVQERYERLDRPAGAHLARGEPDAQLGRQVEVLVSTGEGKKDAETHRLTGRAEDNRLVHFEVPAGSEIPRPGDVVTVDDHARGTVPPARGLARRRAAARSVAPARATRGIATQAESCARSRRAAEPGAPRRGLARPAVAARRRVDPDDGSSDARREPRLYAVVGATGTGKSELSLEPRRGVSPRTGGAAEIVNADAMQLYRGMDIGTAKLPGRRAPRHPASPARRARGHRRRRGRVVPGGRPRGDRRASSPRGARCDPRRRIRPVRVERAVRLPLPAARRRRCAPRSKPISSATGPASCYERLRERGSRDRGARSTRATAAASCAPSRCSPRARRPHGAALPDEPVAVACVDDDHRSARVRATSWSRGSTRASSGCGRTGSSTRSKSFGRGAWNAASPRAGPSATPRHSLSCAATATEAEAIAETQALTRRYARRQVSWFRGIRTWCGHKRAKMSRSSGYWAHDHDPRVHSPRHRVRHRPLASRRCDPLLEQPAPRHPAQAHRAARAVLRRRGRRTTSSAR